MNETKNDYDVIVVGSGAAGGICSYVLSHHGVKVLLLEAGQNYDPKVETPMFESYADAPLRGKADPDGEDIFDASKGGGWSIPGEPYVVKNLANGSWTDVNKMLTATPPNHQSNFFWFRARMLGGRTNHWGRTALRLGPYDFKPKSRDGLGVDWPVGYEEIAPYYDKVDQLIGVNGTKEGLENNPDSNFFQPPPKPRAIDLVFKKAGKDIGIKIIPKRSAILTRPIGTRAACFYATNCNRGCSIGAAFQSPTALIAPALETGNLAIITDAMVRGIILDGQRRASGIIFIDKKTGKEKRVQAKTFILAAGALESTRILLNSRSPQFPNGLGNSTGHLGKWIMDSAMGSHGLAHFPSFAGLPPHNEDGMSVSHTYAPWTKWNAKESEKLGFPRRYYITWMGGRKMPTYDSVSLLLGVTGNSYGKKMVEEARRYYGSFFSFYTPGEMIPNKESFCELDPKIKDKWGIPVLRMNFQWGDHELKQIEHQKQTVQSLVNAANGKLLFQDGNGAKIPSPGGVDNHELGGARMSLSPNDGVTNSWNQVWDCPNIVVADGAVFASNSYKNPTLTIMALAWRACDQLLQAKKQGP
jgi:choline dehydrogenase-like flavoprotein